MGTNFYCKRIPTQDQLNSIADLVVNEKIEDSRGDENKAKKYELIRIKKKLENDLDRVKYRLKES